MNSIQTRKSLSGDTTVVGVEKVLCLDEIFDI
jgi:hypothetical protein